MKKIAGIVLCLIVVALAALLSLHAFSARSSQAKSFAQEGYRCIDEGRNEQARKAFLEALAEDKGFEPALNGLAEIERIDEAVDTLNDVEVLLGRDNFKGAVDLCGEVMRLQPNNPAALDRHALIKTVKKLNNSFQQREWQACLDLLARAKEKWPDCTLISEKLKLVSREILAQQNLEKMIYQLNNNEESLAFAAIKVIPTNSVYYSKARELLVQAQRN